MKTIAILALCAALGGCVTSRTFENRITTTLTGDRTFAAILYGPFGATVELSAEDAAELRRMREAADQARQLGLLMRLQAAQ